jgi:hypothetical protein
MKIYLNLSRCNIHLEKETEYGSVEVSEGIKYRVDPEDNLFIDHVETLDLSEDLPQYGFVRVKVVQKNKPLDLVANLDCCHLIQKAIFSNCTISSKGNSILTTWSKNLVANVENSSVVNFLVEGGNISVNSEGSSTIEVSGRVNNATFLLKAGTDVFFDAEVYGKIELDLDKNSQFYRS